MSTEKIDEYSDFVTADEIEPGDDIWNPYAEDGLIVKDKLPAQIQVGIKEKGSTSSAKDGDSEPGFTFSSGNGKYLSYAGDQQVRRRPRN
jgi:hypothetical protein